MQLYISKNLVLQLRALDGNRMVRSCKTEFIKSHDDII